MCASILFIGVRDTQNDKRMYIHTNGYIMMMEKRKEKKIPPPH
jgi:hypothetical protein